MSKTSDGRRKVVGPLVALVCAVAVIVGVLLVYPWGGHTAPAAPQAPAGVHVSAASDAALSATPAPVKPLTACDLISVSQLVQVSHLNGLTNNGLGTSGTSCSYSHPQDNSLAFVVWANLQVQDTQQNNELFATTSNLAQATATANGAGRPTALKPLAESELNACGVSAGQGAWITSGAYTVGLVVQTSLGNRVGTVGIYAEGSLPQIELLNLAYQTLPKASALTVG